MTYEYRCNGCDRSFEIEASLEEKVRGITPSCPHCGSEETKQLFSPVGFISGAAARREFEPCSPTCACAAEQA
jgi:putative FmdB family regulatory protein